MSGGSGEDVFAFLELVGRLKHVKRTGWVLKDVAGPETVAAHMYRMAMLTFLLQEEDGLDRIRCMEMALVHDLAESIVGDITPHCGVSKEEKHRLEKEAMDKIQILTGTSGQRLHSLFMEYEDQVTDESHFVKELDLFDMTMQAFEYEKRDETPGSLQEFIDATKGKFKHPLLVSLVQRLYSERDGLLKGVPLCPGRVGPRMLHSIPIHNNPLSRS